MEKKTQLSTVHAPAIVHHFDKDMIPFEVYREDDSHLARAHAVAVHPLSGSFSQIHGHNFTHKLLDRPTNRFNGERVGQMSMSEEFFGLLREEECPFHERLYPHTYGTNSFARGLFIKPLNVLLFFLGYGRKQGGTKTHHLSREHFAHAFPRESFYLLFQRRSHKVSIPYQLQQLYNMGR